MRIKKIILKLRIFIKIVWQKILINLSLKYNQPFARPTSIIISLTQNCVLHCQQCHLWKTKPEKQMTFNEAKIVIDKLYKWLGSFYLFFTGGEPFINKDLPKIIKYAEDKGVITHINSNAFLIDDNLAKKILESELSSISISLDGSTPQTHDFLRGTNGAFDHVVRAINLLKVNNYKKKPKISLNAVIMKKNVDELEKLIKLAKKLKVDGLTFQCLLPTLAGGQSSTELDKSKLWPDFNKLKKNILHIIDKYSEDEILLTKKNELEQIIRYYENPKKASKNIVCAARINNFTIDHSGDVFMCFDFPKIGNILENDPKKIWWGKNAQSQRNSIKKCQKYCKVISCNQVEINRQIEIENLQFLNNS